MKTRRWLAILALASQGCAGEGDRATEIVLWEMMDPEERVLLAENVASFEAAQPGVRVSISHYGVEDLRDQFLTKALAGSGPDVVYGPSDNIGPFSVAGTLRPVEEIFGHEFFERFHHLTHDVIDGHLYAVPEQFGNHLVLVRNAALVPNPPQDTGELIAIAKAQTMDENGDGILDRYGLVFETKEPFWLVPWLGGFGGWVMDAERNPTLDTEGMRQALAFVRDLAAKHGVIPKDCDYELADTLFKEGRAAMTINGPWSWSGYRNAGIEIALAPIPKIAGSDRWPTPMVSYRGYSIGKSCPDEKLPLAKALVEYLTGEAVQLAYATKMGSLPSLVALQSSEAIENDPILRESMAQVRLGRRMPVAPAMRAIWDAMRPHLQNVINGESSPEEAARAMQGEALRKIVEMKG